MYKVVQIWPGLFVCKSGDISPGHIWTTLYFPKQTYKFQENKNRDIHIFFNYFMGLYFWNLLFGRSKRTSVTFHGTELILESSKSFSKSRKYTANADDESALLNLKTPLVVSPQLSVFCCWDSEIKKGALRWACRCDASDTSIQNLAPLFEAWGFNQMYRC